MLHAGGLVAFPTETVYGLGADAANPAALRRLYAVKGRPPDHPVIVHLPRGADLDDYACAVPDVGCALADAFWPGPLTLVLHRRAGRVADEATGGRETVGLRVPAHPVALALLDTFGRGIAAPSANRFGRVSPTTAAHVRADLGDDVDVVLDGGPCTVGIESTIVDCTRPEPVVLRTGGVTDAQLATVIGTAPAHMTEGQVAAPGTLAAHYRPHARVEVVTAGELDACAGRHARAGRRVAVLAQRPPPALEGDVVVLTAPRDPDEYAQVLYTRLREADALGADVVVAVPPPPEGVGRAVADRLRRAAAG